MSFDGAASMKRLATLLKQDIGEHMLYVHYFAHCNELVFKDATNSSELLSSAQNLCEELYALVGVSPKRVLLFENIQKEMQTISEDGDTGKIATLKNLSVTRWTTRGSAAQVLMSKTNELKEVLTQLSGDVSASRECRAKSRGLLKKITSQGQLFHLFSMHELAVILEKNSKHFQSSSITAELAVYCIKSVRIRLEELRSEEEFQRILKEVNENEVEETTKRRRINKVMTDFAVHSKVPLHSKEKGYPIEELRRLYFEAIDLLKLSFDSRFDQPDVRKLQNLIRGSHFGSS